MTQSLAAPEQVGLAATCANGIEGTARERASSNEGDPLSVRRPGRLVIPPVPVVRERANPSTRRPDDGDHVVPLRSNAREGDHAPVRRDRRIDPTNGYSRERSDPPQVGVERVEARAVVDRLARERQAPRR